MKVKVTDKADGSSTWYKKDDIYEVKEGNTNTYEVVSPSQYKGKHIEKTFVKII